MYRLILRRLNTLIVSVSTSKKVSTYSYTVEYKNIGLIGPRTLHFAKIILPTPEIFGNKNTYDLNKI